MSHLITLSTIIRSLLGEFTRQFSSFHWCDLLCVFHLQRGIKIAPVGYSSQNLNQYYKPFESHLIRHTKPSAPPPALEHVQQFRTYTLLNLTMYVMLCFFLNFIFILLFRFRLTDTLRSNSISRTTIEIKHRTCVVSNYMEDCLGIAFAVSSVERVLQWIIARYVQSEIRVSISDRLLYSLTRIFPWERK